MLQFSRRQYYRLPKHRDDRTNVKELKIPPNNPVGHAVAKAAEGEIVSFTYDFPKPGTKAPATKETLEARVGKQACGVSYFKT